MKRYFGVDFGTTTTAFAAVTMGDRIDHIGNQEGNPFPSVIIIDKITGEVKYRGLEAWKQRNIFKVDDGHIVISSVKQKFSSDNIWRTNTRLWTPEMVAAEVLKNGTDEIRKRYPDTEFPIEVIMAIPVDFEYEERQKIKEVAKNVGIEVKQFISEPTAAVIGWGENLNNVQHIAVFDWGGGTLDVSVLKISCANITELAKQGKRIGGDTLDELFARYLHNEHKNLFSEIPSFDEIHPRRKDRILTKSELGKRDLSEKSETEIYLPDYCGNKSLESIIDRNIFNNIIRDKIDEAIEVVKNTLAEAELSIEEIDRVLMVGGSSNIPMIKQRMDEMFGARLEFPDKPDWCIARGAAKLAKNSGNYVLSKSIGVVLSDDTFMPILEKGQPIDHKEKKITLGLVEDSKEARLIIAEAKKSKSFSNRITYGKYQTIDALTMNIPSAGYHFEPIEAGFRIKKDLTLEVTAFGKFNQTEKLKKIYPHLKFEYRIAQNEK
ncbi:Chaperone Hsp70 family protein [Desulfonema limicola]|uniref:Chaperone Hsp70 family protein n=1 Tax=Desulfonema limicola TaxID=45656 RepID=A0A975GF02_9BACT|nr:Hsp70 family protein [Desulfonema limicola]QTA78674.1 Chaperone Hsp70 family protein [Desulfonema limicola]